LVVKKQRGTKVTKAEASGEQPEVKDNPSIPAAPLQSLRLSYSFGNKRAAKQGRQASSTPV
jgi:hypothetical protein